VAIVSWTDRLGLIVSLKGVAIAARVAGQNDDMPGLSLWLDGLAFVLFGAALLVLSWPFLSRTRLVWPRERLFARYPSVRTVEHEQDCRAWARDITIVDCDDFEGRRVVRATCGRCGAKHEQRYIPRGHPDFGVRCPGDD
jgi:hypothetical protein